MKRILEYIHRPNKTEVGIGTNTNDSYLKLPPILEESELFLKNQDDYFLHVESGEKVLFKAIKYQTGGKEYRLTKLGAVRHQYNIECGDELIFRRELSSKNNQPTFEIRHFNKTLFYSSSKGKFIIIYPERLPNWNSDSQTKLAVYSNGELSTLEINFLEAKRARTDSPDTTDYYSISLNGNIITGKSYCLSYRDDRMVFCDYDKWFYNEVNY